MRARAGGWRRPKTFSLLLYGGLLGLLVQPPLSIAAPLLWTADGNSLGGSGAWTSSGIRWTATVEPLTAVAWSDGAEAVFLGTPGTVTLAEPLVASSLRFGADGYVVDASPGGRLTTSGIEVTNFSDAAEVAVAVSGDKGLAKAGDGLLVLRSTANDYSGPTQVLAGTLQTAAADVLPDASPLVVSRFAEVDFATFADTVAGLSGEGSVVLGSVLTVSMPDDQEVRFDGGLAGEGDLVVDAPGLGTLRLDTTAATKADKLEKAYAGRTLIRQGTLAVDTTATPTMTSAVEVLPAGQLTLATPDGQYTFGESAATVVKLAGGRLGQAADTVVLLANTVEVTADSTLAIANTPQPDPLNAAAEGILLTGPLLGEAGTTLSITASETTAGADTARVVFASLSGNTFAGTVRPELNAVAAVDGVYSGMQVQLAGGRVEGSGFLQSIAGAGSVAPRGITSGAGVLTAESLTIAAETSFEFGFGQVNEQPDWFYPSDSLNDGLRLTGNDPLPVALSPGNTVQLFLEVSELLADDAFYGGFLTRTDATSLITNASFSTYVFGDGKGVDAIHNGIGFYALDTFNASKGIEVEATVSMKQVSASFNGLSKEPAYLMQAVYAVPTGPVVVDVGSGVVTQTAAGYPLFSGTRGLTKTGGGALVLDQANTHRGVTTVAAGTLAVTTADALSLSPTAVEGGRLEVAVDATMPSLAIEEGTVVLTAATRRVLGLETLSISEDAGGGLFDLGRGRVDIAAGGISSADLRADIIAGRGGGGWDGATGISSHVAAADTRFGVGYRINSDSGMLSVAWAALGDSNLDGLVNFDDILALFPNYNQPGSYTWQEGDFTYDGLVNFDDILALFPNYNQPDYLAGGLGGSGAAAGGSASSGEELLSLFEGSGGSGAVSMVTVVPEPSSLWLWSAGGLAAGAWRRCRSRKTVRAATTRA